MTPLLQIINLHKHYQTEPEPTVALHDISMELAQGQVFALLGPNGAGKTTLSSVIASLTPPSSGEVRWNGASIELDLLKYRRAVGYCPQRTNLNPTLNLRENLLFAARFYGLTKEESLERLEILARQLDLDDYLDAMPMVLSGGWKQRFMMARALMHDPYILILDEPTVGLDPYVRRQIWKVVKLLREQGVAILLTTHYLEEAEQLADWVCMMDKGKIKLIERPDELMRQFEKSNLEAVYLQLLQEEAGEA